MREAVPSRYYEVDTYDAVMQMASEDPTNGYYERVNPDMHFRVDTHPHVKAQIWAEWEEARGQINNEDGAYTPDYWLTRRRFPYYYPDGVTDYGSNVQYPPGWPYTSLTRPACVPTTSNVPGTFKRGSSVVRVPTPSCDYHVKVDGRTYSGPRTPSDCTSDELCAPCCGGQEMLYDCKGQEATWVCTRPYLY